MLTYLQLLLGLVLPALGQAVLQARLFQRHNEQRRLAGVAAENGWAARAYACVSDVTNVLDGPGVTMALWVLLGIIFDVAVALNFKDSSVEPTVTHSAQPVP